MNADKVIREENELLKELNIKISELQKDVTTIKNRIDDGITLKEDKEIGDEKANQDSVKKSMDYMLDAFGFSDE